MNKIQDWLIQTYAGLIPAQAEAFFAASLGDRIHPATMTSFVEHGLVAKSKDHLTEEGAELLLRMRRILSGEFIPPPPEFPLDDLRSIEYTARFARMREMKAEKLRSVHLKILIRAAKFPLAAEHSYHDAFGYPEIDLLIERGYIGLVMVNHKRYAPVRLARTGRVVLECCIAIAKNMEVA